MGYLLLGPQTDSVHQHHLQVRAKRLILAPGAKRVFRLNVILNLKGLAVCPHLTGNQAFCGELREVSQVSSVLGPSMRATGCIFAGCIYLRGELCPEKQDNSLIVESNSGFKSVGCCLAVSTTGHSSAALKLPICFKALV